MIVLAAYDRNGKMLQARCEDVLSDTQIESQKRIRMENPDGNIAEIRVFLISSVEEPRPLCRPASVS